MPTNVLRQTRSTTPSRRAAARQGETRHVLIRAGRVAIHARLLDTPTADRIWQALPIFSTAEVRGHELSFETAVESGRERGARMIIAPGEIAFAPERDAIAIAFAAARGSGQRAGYRLWSPSNIWAQAIEDVSALAAVRAGEKVEVVRLDARDLEPPLA